jgi:hypothetical protein
MRRGDWLVTAAMTLVVGCSPTQPGGPARGTPVTVLGDRLGIAALRQAGCLVRDNVRPEADDVVLVALSCRRGVEDGLFDALEKAAGSETRHLAILLTNAAGDLDPDLIELVEIQARFVLTAVAGGEEEAFEVPVLRADDPRLGEKIEELATRPAKPIRLARPDRQAWQEFLRHGQRWDAFLRSFHLRR